MREKQKGKLAKVYSTQQLMPSLRESKADSFARLLTSKGGLVRSCIGVIKKMKPNFCTFLSFFNRKSRPFSLETSLREHEATDRESFICQHKSRGHSKVWLIFIKGCLKCLSAAGYSRGSVPYTQRVLGPIV